MAQQHLDRLTSTDASFLHQEGPASHMHIGGTLIFEGPAPDFEQYLDHVRGRLHLVPRYRQKLASPPLGLGRQRWIDDPSFNLEYHVRHSALPPPGTEDQLLQLAARIASQQLDRARPLWESWLIEGLEPAQEGGEERFALIFKTHHSLVDGVSGADLATVLFDLSPEPGAPPTELEPWQPHPEPTPAELLATAAVGAASLAGGVLSRAAEAAVHPERSLAALREVAEGVGEIVWAALNPAPEMPLNVPIGPHRRFVVVRQELSQYKEIKNAFGGTVNDVVLAVVSGALARWLRSRGIRTDGVELRALVPVSVRTDDQRGALGNRLTAMRGPLPVYIRDPVARLGTVRRAMDELKGSKQGVGAATLAAVNELAPPAILAQASRLQFSTRLFNLLVTNIPGPQFPLYVLGRRLLDLFPVAFLPENHALAIAILSYDGGIDFGLLGDWDALPDIGLIAEGIEAALGELLVAARGQSPAEARKRAGGAQGERRAKSAPASANANRRAHASGNGNGNGNSNAGGSGKTNVHGNGAGGSPVLPSTGGRPASGPAADMRAKRSHEGRRSQRPGGPQRTAGNGSRKAEKPPREDPEKQ